MIDIINTVSEKARIQIIDLGICNLTSLTTALQTIGVEWEVTKESKHVGKNCDSIILPGVGAFNAGMEALKQTGMENELKRIAIEGNLPLLGICLGMQLFFDSSEEHGEYSGIGLIPGRVCKLEPVTHDFLVPNVGWCVVDWLDKSSPIVKPPDNPESFYFIHSYWCKCTNDQDVIGTVDMGFPMTAAVQSNKIIGTQFHPEKSLDAGFDLLNRFVRFSKSVTL